MSNGVEVLVRDKSSDGKQEQRKNKVMQLNSSKTSKSHEGSTLPNKSLLSSVVATVVNRQQMSAFFPLQQLMQHNYIIKTCMTTYTYLTTVVQNKRSAISTFETIVSVVTTESLTNLYATDVLADLKPTKTKYMEVKTIHPSAASNMFLNNMPKIEKRIDNQEEHNFDLIQPSEISHTPCTASCPCSHSKTEGLKTKHTNLKQTTSYAPDKYVLKNTKYSTKIDMRPTRKESIDQTLYHPYEYETSSHAPPTDKMVEKYTQVTDYSDEKDSNSVETSELLTNEQAPPSKTNSGSGNNTSIKNKPDKTHKVNKNKFVMAELIKLGSLGIKSLSQLAPVIEKMTGGFMKRQESNKTTTTTTTVKPKIKDSSYIASKRVDNDLETKGGNFPIYIPVDDMETSESQISFKNVTLQQNFAWATENKHSKAHLVKPKIVYESPLLNGGIPISPGEIITANSDVIVGKPAVGGPLTLAASGIKLQNPVHPPLIDNVVANNDQYIVKEKPMNDQSALGLNTDDSFDLRPPELPKIKTKQNINILRPVGGHSIQQNSQQWLQPPSHTNEPIKHSGLVKNKSPLLVNHGRPAFLDFVPSLNKPNNIPKEYQANYKPISDGTQEQEFPDNNPSSSEIVSTKITTDGEYADIQISSSENKPFLVDIQPSRVANVLIPHGSSTALVFAGSTEPHKTGDYIDDPLPYPEPGYFGSFSIDAPHMTNVHNVVLNKNQFFVKQGAKSTPDSYLKNVTPRPLIHKDTGLNNDQKLKWNENKRPKDLVNIPPPTSNQETHIQIGPQITTYNPEIYKVDFEKNNKINKKPKEGKDVIDKEYENYLAVPPPPPKMHFNQETRYDKKRYQQRPVVHTKPVQDSNTFLNVQHPISNQLPPKVTSEIYFASQLPNNQATPTYTFKIPQSPTSGTSTQAKYPKNSNNQQAHKQVTSANTGDKSIITGNNKDHTYTVTLNTATNVASSSNTGHVVGSSITVPITTTSLNGQINANIPIGTNFAIRVEDDPAKYESVALHGKRHPSLIFDNHENVAGNSVNVYTGNNFEFKSNLTQPQKSASEIKTNIDKNTRDKTIHKGHSNVLAPSINSHANFPMINEDIITYENTNVHYDDSKEIDYDKRPSPFVPELATNSHGWYASVLTEDNIKNIQVEASTRKTIPLNFDNSSNNLPEFGEKIATVGKPPAEFWNKKNKQTVNNFSVGKPFSKPIEGSKPDVLPFTIRPNYIPSIFSNTQPVYDIPVRDNSEETSTTKNINSKPKPVYETAEEIYDGEEESESNSESDGEVSSESMKVPIITPSSNKRNFTNTNSVSIPESYLSQNKPGKGVQLVDFNPGTQTEKPFNSINKTTFHSNNMVPIFEHNPYMKPRPFTVNTGVPLDHQLQQPHWQINQLMENSTNASYEDMELTIGKEKYTASTNRPYSTSKPTSSNVIENKHKNLHSNRNTVQPNNTRLSNESNIITSTIQIQDKKPLIVEIEEKSTLPTFTIKTESDILSNSSIEIIDLSPPPPSMNYNFKPSITDEIMGMSPPPRNPLQRIPSRAPQTPRPILPLRTPAPHRPMPPKTLPPRQSTQRPLRKPIRDEVSTYRPTYDIINKVKRPNFNADQPSSHLLPPPRDLPSKISSVQNIPKPTTTVSSVVSGNVEKVIFPTLVSSSWLTSSNFDFSSSFNFGPTPVFFPDSVPTQLSEDSKKILESSSEYSNEYETSSETVDYSGENPVKQGTITISKQVNRTSEKEFEFSNENVDSSKEDVNKDKMKVIPIGNKNRTRKPYPVRNDDKKPSTNKFKLPSKSVPIIRPTRTLYRPEFSHPTRSTSIRKIVRPLPSRPLAAFPTSIIESSESSIDEEYIKPTEVLKQGEVSTIVQELPSVIEKTVTTTFTISKDPSESNIHKSHHGGNEIKISDEIIPTKTEFKTTVITLTKTLSEPPQIVSSIGYVNLTHTLTVTHTETSLVSQSEGAVTETLILTNTQTSTIVDVVTKVYTEVQPTTIVETVTKHIPIVQVESTPVIESTLPTKIALDDITMSSEEKDNFIIRDNDDTENVQKIETEEKDNDTFFVVMNKSQNGGKSPPINTDIETGDYDGITRTEQVNNNGVSQVLFGEILLAGTPYLETTNVGHPTGIGYGKECQPDCKASRNERCQRIDGIMKCVCRPGFARMFPDRPCKPTYTYSVRLALGSQGNQRLRFHASLSDNSSKEYHSLAVATHEGINRMVMQSDLRDVYHGVHINGFHPIEMKTSQGERYQGVINDFYVQLSDNAHESRLKEVIEKYLRNNNYSLGGTEVHAAEEFIDRLNVTDFDECTSTQFHDCSEHARCFNLRGTYTCSCLEGFADLSVNTLYPGRICSSDAVGCSTCNYHGTCFERENAMICECFKWYAGKTCQVNLKAVLITVTVIGLVIIAVVTIWASKRCCCQKVPVTQTFVIGCMQGMPNLHQGNMPSKQRADRRALITERIETAETCSVQNTSLPYIPAKSRSRSCSRQLAVSAPPAHAPPPPPAPALMIPRARLHPLHSDSRDNLSRKKSSEICSEAKLISYLESGATNATEEMRRKHSMESSYSINKERSNKQGALVSAGFKVSTTVRPEESVKEDRDDASSINKTDLEAEMSRFDTLRKTYSQEDLSEWTDAERRIGELTLSEARSVGGTLPASTGRAASSTRLTHQEANTMAERDLGSTFLLPHVHLYKPDLTSDVSEFDSL